MTLIYCKLLFCFDEVIILEKDNFGQANYV
jgi:hypothetical protein